jgi:hypothetical protein
MEEKIGNGRKPDADSALRMLLTAVIRAQSKSRQQICEELSTQVGQDITLFMLNDWTCDAKKPARFPAAFVQAFCNVTGSDELQRFLLSEKLVALLAIGESVAKSGTELKHAQEAVSRIIESKRKIRKA